MTVRKIEEKNRLSQSKMQLCSKIDRQNFWCSHDRPIFLEKNTPFPETRQNLKGPTMLCSSCSQLICLVALDKIIIRVVYYEIKGDINFFSNLICQVNHFGRKDEAEERHSHRIIILAAIVKISHICLNICCARGESQLHAVSWSELGAIDRPGESSKQSNKKN